jgi:AcrR family transcriptional regulator
MTDMSCDRVVISLILCYTDFEVKNMPKETFLNLPDIKKTAVFDAAVKEFSQYRFSEASINRIIKTAGIPRGSFYQYFSNKEDLYQYMYGEIAKELNVASINSLPLDSEKDAFDFFVRRMEVTLQKNREKPEYTKIAMLLEKDDSPFITKLKEASQEDRQRVRLLFNKDIERGLIKMGTDIDLIIDMMYTLSVKEFFRACGDEQLFSKHMTSIIQIIKNGIREVQ